MHPGVYASWVVSNCCDEEGLVVDHRQSYPKLHVTQRQLPLCPAFSGTAKSAPGQNLGCVFADVNIADGTSGQTCYIENFASEDTRERTSPKDPCMEYLPTLGLF